MEPVILMEEPHPSESLLQCKSTSMLMGKKEAVKILGYTDRSLWRTEDFYGKITNIAVVVFCGFVFKLRSFFFNDGRIFFPYRKSCNPSAEVDHT